MEIISKVMDDYANFVMKKSSSAEMRDSSFFLFLSTQKDAMKIMEQNGVDIKKYKNYCNEEIKKEKKYNKKWEPNELTYNPNSNILGFFAKIITEKNLEPTLEDIIKEMVVAIDCAKNNTKEDACLFDFATKKGLKEVLSMGFNAASFNIDKNSLENKYDIEPFEGLGLDLLDEIRNSVKSKNEETVTDFLDLCDLEGQEIFGFDKEINKLIRAFSREEKTMACLSGARGVGKKACLQGFLNKAKESGMQYLKVEPFWEAEELIDYLDEAEKEGKILIYEEVSKHDKNNIAMLDEYDVKALFVSAKFTYNSGMMEIALKERSFEDIFKIVKAKKLKYETFYSATIGDNIIKDCINYSSKYLKQFSQPMAAIQLMDVAGTYAQNDSAYEYKTEYLQKALKDYYDVSGEISIDSKAKLLHLSEELSKEVIGQKDVFDKIRSYLLRKTVFEEKGKPMASFLFAGSSGVGKTETAKQMAALLERPILIYNMAEFSDATAKNSFTGSGAGYIGSENGGRIVNDLIANPNAIVVFDEIEKAHEDVRKILLGVFDEAKISDAKGSMANLENNIFISTTNAGIGTTSSRKSIGYSESKNIVSSKYNNFEDGLLKAFPSELLGRMQLLKFNSLDENSAKEIVKLNLNKFKKHCKKNMSVNVNFDQNVVAQVVKDAISPTMGARNIKNYMANNIEGPVAEMFIGGKIKNGNNLVLKYNSENKNFDIKKFANKKDVLNIVGMATQVIKARQ